MNSSSNLMQVALEAILTADRPIVAPVVATAWLSCLGKRGESFPVVVCELPKNVLLEGLLGMDFLKICNAVIDANQAEITGVV
ncbi:MAG: hypothetical protein MUF49_17265 [Oculatellaceae cyanobacterium Prado106]|jgi:hypothetical protein|nr:hypothetical protein [Oculatellaceae cyanobacterium Prado106]